MTKIFEGGVYRTTNGTALWRIDTILEDGTAMGTYLDGPDSASVSADRKR